MNGILTAHGKTCSFNLSATKYCRFSRTSSRVFWTLASLGGVQCFQECYHITMNHIPSSQRTLSDGVKIFSWSFVLMKSRFEAEGVHKPENRFAKIKVGPCEILPVDQFAEFN